MRNTLMVVLVGLALNLTGCALLRDLGPVEEGGQGMGATIGKAVPGPYGDILGWVLTGVGSAALGGVALAKERAAAKFKKIATAAVTAIETTTDPEVKKRARQTSFDVGVPQELDDFVREVNTKRHAKPNGVAPPKPV